MSVEVVWVLVAAVEVKVALVVAIAIAIVEEGQVVLLAALGEQAGLVVSPLVLR